MARPSRILLVIPFWDGDAIPAMETAQLAHDLLIAPTDRVGILFARRFDARPLNKSFMDSMSPRFVMVDEFQCRRKGTGFPMGCNELFFGIFAHLIDRRSKLLHDFDCALILESDAVLTRPSWHVELLDEWDRAQRDSKFVVGTRIPTAHEHHAHINACALYSRQIAEMVDLMGCSGEMGWDWALGKLIEPLALDSPLFRLDYQAPTVTRRNLFSGPLVYHGVKDDSARRYVRQKHLS